MDQDASMRPPGTVAGGAHEEFLKQYASAQPALQHFLAVHIPDLHEVDDLMQEVAVCLWKKFSEFIPGTSFRKWAFRVAQYEILHARRAHARHPALLLPQLTEEAAERFEATDVESVEARRRALERCLERLPAPQRELILARYRSERSGRELAKDWGHKTNHVWVQLYRIRTALRRCVEGSQAGPEVTA
jgi:RNA polymerase sigma-70 factor (ECF subfamily)